MIRSARSLCAGLLFMALGKPGLALATAAALGACPDAHIELATRDQVTLTLAHFDAWMARIPPEDRAGFADSPSRIEARLLELLRQAEFARMAEREGLIGPGQHNEARAVAEHRWSTESIATLPLADCPAQLEELRRAHQEVIRNQVFSNVYLEHAIAARIPERLELLAEERYLTNRNDFQSQEVRRVRYLFVSAERHPDPEQRARELLELANAAPARFPALIAGHTDSDRYAEDGGLSPEFEWSRDLDSVQRAIFAIAAVGDLHPEPVEVVGGYMLFQLAELTPPRPLSFDEAREGIIETLRAEFERHARIEITNKTAHIPVEADPIVLAHLRTRYAQN